MQKRGQDACPHCRKRVVLRANASKFSAAQISQHWLLTDVVAENLDLAMAQYLQLWFPKEVKLKDNLNRLEAGREELEAMGLHEVSSHLFPPLRISSLTQFFCDSTNVIFSEVKRAHLFLYTLIMLFVCTVFFCLFWGRYIL